MPHPAVTCYADDCDATSHRYLRCHVPQLPATQMIATPHPADTCYVTSRRGLRPASDNPTASSSPQCVTCWLL
ncbi:hypothetical protein AZE42_10339 [Rhizopogon vesiculosus]|uniref:Uncharacterized protein n=1 Tax=Rhizopogon vesiculosus TaxID=180088 RepID=A0A1J8RBZ7_9AGAM|nr:hypothetical protein AZE42_10339 [Rhizopogon vesiculosus]